ncbi:MAG: toll/interleukin-1 receptor domain-containing protein [Acidobacteria bacterium]|nr:toll/interleukin-1 receptor domain-containing protein [Acidobacteriota bacterium]
MAFITRAQIERYERGFSVANEYVATAQKSAAAINAASADTTIFLSHSHKDRDLIEPVIAFLRSHGVSIYVDWMDEGIPDVVSGETAKKIKGKIREQKKFLVMVTENSKDSRWVPWELGFADPVKGMDHIATFPIAEKSDFTQNEYMKIYPKIYYVGEKWYIWRDDPMKFTRLAEWLRS